MLSTGVGPGPVYAQSVTATGDVVPSVPVPPLPTWSISHTNLQVGKNGTGTLTIEDGGSVSSAFGYLGFNPGSNGTVTVNGSGSFWTTNSNALLVGDDGTGVLRIENGGKVENGVAVIGAGAIGITDGVNGTVTVTGPGSSWINSGNLTIGSNGIGKLTIENGGAVSNANGVIGFNPTSDGTVTVTGSGSSWANSGNLYLGGSSIGTTGGNAVLTIQNSGVVNVTGAVAIANKAGSTATLNIGAASGQEAVAPGTLNTGSVGFGAGTGGIVFNHTASNYIFSPKISGAGSVMVEAGITTLTGTNTYTGGTTVEAGTLIGDASSIQGDIANAGSVIFDQGGDTTYGGDIAGYGGADGTMTKRGAGILTLAGTSSLDWSIAAGGLVSSSGRFSGNAAVGTGASFTFDQATGGVYASVLSGSGSFIKTGIGDATLTGDSSTFTGTTTVDGGTLEIAGGGKLGGSNGYIGHVAGSDGTVEVTGAGSAWNSSGILYVGDQGSGTLTVENGGTIANAAAVIGNSSIGEQGIATVTGAGSTWTTGQFDVGFGTTGTLTVADGGEVTSASSHIGFGATGTATVTGAGSIWTASALSIGLWGNSGNGTLTVADGGKVVAPTVGIGTNIGSAGTLNVGAAAGDAAAAAGTLDAETVQFGAGVGTLVFNHTGAITFGAGLSSTGVGAHALNHYAGTTTLTGDSLNFDGPTTVTGGTLLVGDATGNGRLGGTVNVGVGGTLGGSGAIFGATTVDGTLSAGNSPGTLTFASNLTLNSGSTSVFELNSPGIVGGTGATGNDLVVVNGDLALDGTLAARVAAAGYYRLFNYGGNRTGMFSGGTVTGIGDFAPMNQNTPDIQYSIAGQVNLSVLASDQTMQFWDGADTVGNGVVDGGVGTWGTAGTNWTGKPGQAGINGLWGGSVGVFAGNAGGLVVVDDTQSFDTLQFSTNGYELQGGTLAFGVTGGGTLNVDTGVSTTIASTIENGAGSTLRKAGNGTLILTGTNSYAGGTTLLGGVLSVSANANLGATSGGLTFDGGTLATAASFDSDRSIMLTQDGRFDVASATTLGLNGAIDGDGALVKQGAGTLALGGVNSYGGGTTVEAGTLIGDTSSIRGNIGNAGTVVFDQAADGSFAGDISGTGEMVKDGAGSLTLSGTSTLDWTVAVGGLTSSAERFAGDVDIASGASFSFDQSVDALYAGTLSGTGAFNKTGSGVLAYDGDGPGFTGTTTVKEGSLIVGSNAAHEDARLGGLVDVLSGGLLGGHGTVGTVTLASGATIAPGNSIGTLNVAGDITFDAGSVYEVEVDPAGADSDLIHATGQASLNGASVAHIGADGTYKPTSTYTILTADAGIDGTFGSVTSGFAFLTPALSYDADSVYLKLTRNDIRFADIAETRNQKAAAGGLDSLGGVGDLYNAVITLPDDKGTIGAAFNLLSGEIHASARSALIEDSHFVRDAVNDRIRSAFGDATDGDMPVLAYGPDGTKPATADSLGVVSWGRAFGSWGFFDGNGNAAGMDSSTGGFLTGIDASLTPNWRLGFLAGYSRSTFDVDGRASSGNSDNYHFGLYAGGRWNALRLTGGLTYTWHDIETRRSVAFPGFADSLNSDYSAGTFQVFGEAGYHIDTGGIAFEPFANLAYVNLHTDGFTENGGAAALSGRSGTTDTAFTTLGLRASTTFNLDGATLTAKGTIGWRHTFGDVTPLSRMHFAGGDAFTVAGVPIARDTAVVEGGLDYALSSATTLGVTYGGQFGSGAADHTFKANFNVRF